MKTLKILLAVFLTCMFFAGCKPGGQGSETRYITIDVAVEGIPMHAAAAQDEDAALDNDDASDGDAPLDASETLESRDGAISRALTDSSAVYAKVFDTATRIQAVAAVQLDPPDATHTGYHKTLTLPASGAFTILAYAVNASGYHLYSGTGTVTVTNDVANPAVLSITVHGSSDPTGTTAYTTGDWGPGGGYIFYTQGVYATNGWRYMEAAPPHWYGSTTTVPTTTTTTIRVPGTTTTSIDPQATWAGPEGTSRTTGLNIGDGKNNTETQLNTSTYPAGNVCYNLIFNSYTDWFLPSHDELQLMDAYLFATNAAGANLRYWSSSQATTANAWAYRPTDNAFLSNAKTRNRYIRPARQF